MNIKCYSSFNLAGPEPRECTRPPPGVTVTGDSGAVEEQEGPVGMYCGLSGPLHVPLSCDACFRLALGAAHSAVTGMFWAQPDTWTEAGRPHGVMGTVPRSKGSGLPPLDSEVAGHCLVLAQ